MKKLFMVLLLAAAGAMLLASPALADSDMSWGYADANGDRLSLTTEKCDNPAILATIPAEFQGDFRKGTLTVGGEVHDVCYDAVDRYFGQVLVTTEKGKFFFPPELLTLEVRL